MKLPSMTGSRVVSAGGITAGGHLLGRFLRLGSNLILTRLLVPEMFGVLAVASVAITGIAMLSDVGTRQYIFHSKDGLNKETLNTIWIIQILRGVFLSTCMWVLAVFLYYGGQSGWISPESTYGHPQLPFVLAVLAFGPLISGSEATKQHTLNRELSVGKIILMELITQIVSIIVMIIIAYFFRSIWALVAGSVTSSVFRTFMTHVYLPGPGNKFQWNQQKAVEIYSFSRWIFLSSIVGFFVVHADRVWLGGLVSAGTLGVYSIGMSLSALVRSLVTKLSVMVVLPALSKVAREDRGRLSNAYYRVRMIIDTTTFGAAGFLYMTGPTIVDFLYDDRYLDAGRVVSILSLSLVHIGFLQAERCLVAIGQVKQRAMITFVHAAALNAMIPWFYSLYGFEGVLYALVIAPLVPISVYFYYLKKYEVLNLKKEFLFLPVFGIGAGAGYLFNSGIAFLLT